MLIDINESNIALKLILIVAMIGSNVWAELLLQRYY